MEIAAARDAERAQGRVRGPLHGIPVLIKDNIGTADRMETTAGSLAMIGAHPPRDAHLVTRLREAGAVILGKTNLSEWANFRGNRSISGWSGRGGQTLNPHALDRSPSGSSSGSAVAVAADLCVVAVGTETNGSIISPASVCGVVGVKPTVGLVSRSVIIPIAASYDTAGPIARTVRDAAILLDALAGPDPADPATRAAPPAAPHRLAAALQPGALRGKRVGLLHATSLRPNPDAALARAADVLRRLGAEIVDLGVMPTGSRVGEVLSFEFKAGLESYLSTLGPQAPRSLADLIRFNLERASDELAHFGQEDFIAAQARGPLTDPSYRQARATAERRARTEGIDALLTRGTCDLLMTIATAPAGLIRRGAEDPVFGKDGPGGAAYGLAAVAGYPSVTVPLGQISGLPYGILFFGPAWSEPTLLAAAAEFEGATHARRGPEFRATAGP
jgi:amidase